MKVVFETRFTFFGKSGWRSEASRDPAGLFDEDRLKARFSLFENITLPSLVAQTDPDFKQIVLSSTRMPNKWKTHLSELCHDTLGADRCLVHFNNWGHAGRIFRRLVRKMAGDQPDEVTAQVVLDDDDAVSMNFVELCRRESLNAAAYFTSPEDYSFLSFPRGYSMKIAENSLHFITRQVDFTNLGLTLVAPTKTRRNPFLTSHRKIGQRRPSRVISDLSGCYIRTVHQNNDSRGMHDDDGPEVPLEQVQQNFPAIGAFHQKVTAGQI